MAVNTDVFSKIVQQNKTYKGDTGTAGKSLEAQ